MRAIKSAHVGHIDYIRKYVFTYKEMLVLQHCAAFNIVYNESCYLR